MHVMFILGCRDDNFFEKNLFETNVTFNIKLLLGLIRIGFMSYREIPDFT